MARHPVFALLGMALKTLQIRSKKLMAAGCEVGLHGIDAWLDSSKGS